MRHSYLMSWVVKPVVLLTSLAMTLTTSALNPCQCKSCSNTTVDDNGSSCCCGKKQDKLTPQCHAATPSCCAILGPASKERSSGNQKCSCHRLSDQAVATCPAPSLDFNRDSQAVASWIPRQLSKSEVAPYRLWGWTGPPGNSFVRLHLLLSVWLN